MFIDKIKKVLVVAACGMLISGNCFGMKEVKINVSSLVKTVHTKEYTVCKTIEEMHNFMVCAFLEKLEVPLIEAIETIIANTAEEVCGFNAENGYKNLPEKDKPLIAVLVFTAFNHCSRISLTAAAACLSILNDIAGNDYDAARLILRSQCADDNYTPKQDANLDVFEDVIRMLKYEKDGHNSEAAEFLKKLGDVENHPYEYVLGDIRY